MLRLIKVPFHHQLSSNGQKVAKVLYFWLLLVGVFWFLSPTVLKLQNHDFDELNRLNNHVPVDTVPPEFQVKEKLNQRGQKSSEPYPNFD